MQPASWLYFDFIVLFLLWHIDIVAINLSAVVMKKELAKPNELRLDFSTLFDYDESPLCSGKPTRSAAATRQSSPASQPPLSPRSAVSPSKNG